MADLRRLGFVPADPAHPCKRSQPPRGWDRLLFGKETLPCAPQTRSRYQQDRAPFFALVSGTARKPGIPISVLDAMQYRGIEYGVVQTTSPTGWKRTVQLDQNRTKTGTGFSRATAVGRPARDRQSAKRSQQRARGLTCRNIFSTLAASVPSPTR
jgi:hypothetical protein